ncbi:hypothetical protein CUTER_01260 [Corynebacterium uterequi]|uniref:DUF2127 domain-containing protein n=2 Tax=Corynebacterium uterequi TaxID=1072256 RepID=A0A0G3HGL9_9CORY|nr:hypothetical protein CUTER_01260 [Corynebacterium uterequi]
MLRLWAAAVGAELIHQIISIISGFLDPSELLAASKESLSDNPQFADMPDAMLRLSVYVSIGLLGLLNLAIVGGLGAAVVLISRRGRTAPGAQRLLIVFSIFWAVRGLVILTAQATYPGLPDWLVLLDGSLQIIIAVAGVLGIIFARKPETVSYFDVDRGDER